MNQAQAAETPKQIKAAKVALKRWQATHPNDPPNERTARTTIYEGGLAKNKARMGLVGSLRRCSSGCKKGRGSYTPGPFPAL